jgi:hypothetical protein
MEKKNRIAASILGVLSGTLGVVIAGITLIAANAALAEEAKKSEVDEFMEALKEANERLAQAMAALQVKMAPKA